MAITDEEYSRLLRLAQMAVGRFLWHWALMELSLRNALQKVLRLDDIQIRVVASNIQLRDKIHILRTAINLDGPTPSGASLDKTLKEIGDYSATRNMMVHDLYAPTEDGTAVEFFTVKAKGKLVFPENRWETKDFQEAYAKIDGYTKVIKDHLGSAYLGDILGTALRTASPISPPFGLIPGGPPPLPIPGLLGGGLSTPKADDKTPPPEKE